MGWAVDVLLQSKEDDPLSDNSTNTAIIQRKREALECLAYVRDVLNPGKLPKALDEDILVGESEVEKRRVESEAAKARAKTKQARDAAEAFTPEKPTSELSIPGTYPTALAVPEATMHPAASSSHSPTQIASGLPATSSGLPRTYLSSRDFTPVSALPRTPYIPQTSRASLTPKVDHPPSGPLPPWQSTPSSFDSLSAGSTLRRPPPISNVSGGQQGTVGNALRHDSARRRTSQAAVDNIPSPPQTYQSDPLRG